MRVIREEINTELIFETYKVKVNDPNVTYSRFCIYILGTSVTIVNGWKNSTKTMSQYKKDKVFSLTALVPHEYTKIVTLYV